MGWELLGKVSKITGLSTVPQVAFLKGLDLYSLVLVGTGKTYMNGTTEPN